MENNLKFNDFELKLKEYAKLHKVPIIQDEGLSFLLNVIKLKKPLNILEVGTAIGYSSILMAKNSNAKIYTIERDINMYNEAKKNILECNLDNKINIIFKDALLAFDDVKDVKFDLIFIDAAKAQYTKFFNLYEPLLNECGVIVCDNMLFHGLVESTDTSNLSRSVRGLVRKLNDFHKFLLENDKYDTSIYDIGDGMSISIKK